MNTREPNTCYILVVGGKEIVQDTLKELCSEEAAEAHEKGKAVVEFCDHIAEALQLVFEGRPLDLVSVRKNPDWDEAHTGTELAELALYMSEHPDTPWVVFSKDDTWDAARLFEQEKVRTITTDIWDAVPLRFKERIAQAA